MDSQIPQNQLIYNNELSRPPLELDDLNHGALTAVAHLPSNAHLETTTHSAWQGCVHSIHDESHIHKYSSTHTYYKDIEHESTRTYYKDIRQATVPEGCVVERICSGCVCSSALDEHRVWTDESARVQLHPCIMGTSCDKSLKPTHSFFDKEADRTSEKASEKHVEKQKRVLTCNESHESPCIMRAGNSDQEMHVRSKGFNRGDLKVFNRVFNEDTDINTLKYDKHEILKHRTNDTQDKHIIRVLSISKIKRFLIASVNKYKKTKDINTLELLNANKGERNTHKQLKTYNAQFKNTTVRKQTRNIKGQMAGSDLHRWSVREGSCWAPDLTGRQEPEDPQGHYLGSIASGWRSRRLNFHPGVTSVQVLKHNREANEDEQQWNKYMRSLKRKPNTSTRKFNKQMINILIKRRREKTKQVTKVENTM